MVSRPRLLNRLREDQGKTLVLRAPSGYGKSVLLEQLAALDRRSSHTVLLSARDNDPTFLVRSITAALGESEPFPEDVLDALRAPQPDIDNVVVPRLLAGLEARREPFLLILDELEWLESPGSLAIVAALVRGMPAGSQLAIASRVEPPLRLGRLRAEPPADRAAPGGPDDDQRRVRRAAGVDRARAPAAPARHDRAAAPKAGPRPSTSPDWRSTESADAGRTLSRFAGDDRVVVDYLREEFLLPASRRQLEFLRQASVLERMSGELCDAVLERDDSATILRDLARSNMLLDLASTGPTAGTGSTRCCGTCCARSCAAREPVRRARACTCARPSGGGRAGTGTRRSSTRVEAGVADRAGELLLDRRSPTT